MFIMSHSVPNHCSVGRMSINLNAEDLGGEAKYSILQHKIVYILLRQNFISADFIAVFCLYKKEMFCLKQKQTKQNLEWIKLY